MQANSLQPKSTQRAFQGRLLGGLALVVGLFASASASSAQYESVKPVGYSIAQFSTSDEASIDLYDRTRQIVAILVFLPVDEAELPAAYRGDEDGVIRLYYTRDRLGSMVDMLRNESGVTVRLWVGPLGEDISHVATTVPERVGGGAP